MHNLMPPVLGRSALQPVELPARLCELRVLVPTLPVGAGPPRADDHPPVWLIGWPEELSSYPTRLLSRGRQTRAHGDVPITSCPLSQVHMRHDSHHRWLSLHLCDALDLTLSARASSEGGMVRASTLAVLRLGGTRIIERQQDSVTPALVELSGARAYTLLVPNVAGGGRGHAPRVSIDLFAMSASHWGGAR